jgi:ABC-2 type transport system ATP-binding protein
MVGYLSEMLDVKHLLNVQVRRLSLGERMKMELIASLIHKPQILFLDEPTIGLDFISQKACAYIWYLHKKLPDKTNGISSKLFYDDCNRNYVSDGQNTLCRGSLSNRRNDLWNSP